MFDVLIREAGARFGLGDKALPVAQMLRLRGGTSVLMPALNDQPVLPLVRIWS